MHKKRKILWGIFYTVLVLGVGIFLGRFSDYVLQDHSEFRNPENRRIKMKAVMVRELGLSLDQSKKVDLILDHYRPAFDAHLQQMHQLRDRLDTDIAVILTPQQKLSFEKLKQRHRSRHRFSE